LLGRLLAAALAIVFLAWAGVAHAATAHMRILVDIQSSVGVEVAQAYSWGNFDVGENESDEVEIRVRSNVPYSLTILADKVHLTEFDTSTLTYVSGGKTLTNVLEWQPAGASGYTPITATPVLIRTGLATTSAGDSTLVRFRQIMVYEDTPLSDPAHRYSAMIRYAAMPTV
jgi:hypothetical protein